jgi:hypothetical protein
MALDVHVIDDPSPKGLAGEWPVCQFEEDVHSYVVHGAGIDVYSRYAYLRRIIDFCADASYSGDALGAVVGEIDDLLPHLSANQKAVETMGQFRSACANARAAGKSVFLIL